MFIRSQNPKVAMSIGKRAEIVKWFSDLEIKSDKYENNLIVHGDLYKKYKHN